MTLAATPRFPFPPIELQSRRDDVRTRPVNDQRLLEVCFGLLSPLHGANITTLRYYPTFILFLFFPLYFTHQSFFFPASSHVDHSRPPGLPPKTLAAAFTCTLRPRRPDHSTDELAHQQALEEKFFFFSITGIYLCTRKRRDTGFKYRHFYPSNLVIPTTRRPPAQIKNEPLRALSCVTHTYFFLPLLLLQPDRCLASPPRLPSPLALLPPPKAAQNSPKHADAQCLGPPVATEPPPLTLRNRLLPAGSPRPRGHPLLRPFSLPLRHPCKESHSRLRYPPLRTHALHASHIARRPRQRLPGCHHRPRLASPCLGSR